MYRAKLFLSNFNATRLDEFQFNSPHHPTPLIAFNGGLSPYSSNTRGNLFTWTAAVRALTLLLVRHAAGPEHGEISGEARTPASSLDYALSKEPGWLLDFFGTTNREASVAKHLFSRWNSERKRPGPVRIFVNSAQLPSENVEVYVGGKIVTDKQELLRVAEKIEAGFGEGSNRAGPKKQRAETEDSPYVVHEYHSRLELMPSENLGIYESRAEITTTSPDPANYLHWNFTYSGTTSRPTFHQDQHELEAESVLATETTERFRVLLREPLTASHPQRFAIRNTERELNTADGFLQYIVRAPIDLLSLTVVAPGAYEFSRCAVLGEREGSFLFATLPEPVLTTDDRNHQVLHWTHVKPEEGFRFRIYWRLDERTAASVSKTQPPTLERDESDERFDLPFRTLE